MKSDTDRASQGEKQPASSDRRQAVTALTDRELERVAGGAGKKGGSPEFRA
jgi:hypothetical protein